MFVNIIRFLVRIFYRCAYRVKVVGKENIPKDCGVLITPNHISNWDPALVGAFCPRQVKFMAKSELFDNKIFASLITALGAFPVERGGGDIEAVKTAIRLLKNDQALVMFPHGKRIKPGSDVPIKEGAVMIGLRAGVKIVPAYIKGDYKPFRRVTLIFGESVDYTGRCGKRINSEIQKEIATDLWQKMKSLGDVIK